MDKLFSNQIQRMIVYEPKILLKKINLNIQKEKILKAAIRHEHSFLEFLEKQMYVMIPERILIFVFTANFISLFKFIFKR